MSFEVMIDFVITALAAIFVFGLGYASLQTRELIKGFLPKFLDTFDSLKNWLEQKGLMEYAVKFVMAAEQMWKNSAEDRNEVNAKKKAYVSAELLKRYKLSTSELDNLIESAVYIMNSKQNIE